MSKRGGAASGAEVGRSGAVVLGGDPGEVGAAVVLDGHHVRESLSWKTEDDVGPLVFDLCRRWGVTRAAIEWSAKTRGVNERMPPAARVTLARRAQMLATAAACAGAEVRFVGCDDWRAEVLRLSGSTSGDRAKDAAIAACWGGMTRRLDPGLGLVWPPLTDRSSHVAEAACVAVWAQRW